MSRFVAVAGNIGAGKSSLVDFLRSHYGFAAVYEPFGDNPYLDDFYADMDAWAFHSQVYFLSHKFRLHCELMGDLERAPRVVVQDRTIYEDAEIFCTNLHKAGHLSDRDYRTYMELYESMSAALRPPDLLIYLRCSVRAIRRRIRRRGRASEQDIPTAYLRKLNDLYEGWVERYDKSPVLVWESDRADYLTDLVDQIAFKDRLQELLK